MEPTINKRKRILTDAIKEFEAAEVKEVHDYVKLFVAANNSLARSVVLPWKDLKESIENAIAK